METQKAGRSTAGSKLSQRRTRRLEGAVSQGTEKCETSAAGTVSGFSPNARSTRLASLCRPSGAQINFSLTQRFRAGLNNFAPPKNGGAGITFNQALPRPEAAARSKQPPADQLQSISEALYPPSGPRYRRNAARPALPGFRAQH